MAEKKWEPRAWLTRFPTNPHKDCFVYAKQYRDGPFDQEYISRDEAEAIAEERERKARADAFKEAAEIMGKGPDWFDRYRDLLAKVNEAAREKGGNRD